MTGKEKCRALRDIREAIARANDIRTDTRECTHQGDCAGTCPYCEGEAKKLEEQLKTRESLGKRIALVGLCAGLALSGAGCAPDGFEPEVTGIMPMPTIEDALTGDIAQRPDTVVEMGDILPEDAQ